MKLFWIAPEGRDQRILRFVHDGLALSVSLGAGSYSDGRESPIDGTAEGLEMSVWRNSTMELALFFVDADGNDRNDTWVKLTPHEDVAGHMPISLLGELLTALYQPESPETRASRITWSVRAYLSQGWQKLPEE